MFGWAAAGDVVVESQQLLDLAAQTSDVFCQENPSKAHFYASVPLPDSSRCIRVLDLYPAESSRRNSPLVGHLRVVDLDRAPSFTALSYVWGATAESCDTVLCQPQGCRLEVTPNCHSALWSLRKRFGAVTIWVDSLCINQADEDEKAAQIPLMSRIYAGSERLYVWLGPGNKTSDTAMEYLALFATLRERLPFHLVVAPNWPTGRRQRLYHIWMARLRTLSEAPARLRMFLTHRWMARHVRLDELFARDWIRRAWTFQELILSPNPVVVCGDKILAWEDMIDFVVSSDDYFENKAGTYLAVLGAKPRASADSLANWASAVTLWLTFGRHGSSSNNLARLVELDGANRIVRWAKATVGFLLYPTAIVGYFTACWMLLSIVSHAIAGTERAWIPKLIVTAIFLGTLYWQIMIPAVVVLVCWHVAFGVRPPWARTAGSQPQESGSELSHVEGVRVALRERAVTKPHDKAFSVLAILKTLGSEEVEIDYRRPLSDCFKDLFVSMVKLHPPALLMLCDAGLSPDSERWTGPSWVPNWMVPPPNAGVSSHLRIPTRRGPEDTSFGPGDQYQVNGGSLSVSMARFIGQIGSQGSVDDHNWDPLRRICAWYRFIRMNSIHLPAICVTTVKTQEEKFREQYHDSVVFAAFEGLPCPQQRRKAVYEERETSEGGTEKTRRRPHEAPLDFSGLEKEFNDFLKFRAMLDELCLAEPPLGQDIVPVLRRQLSGDGRAARYCDRLMAKLAKDDRAFIVVGAKPYELPEGYWIGTAPLAAMPGDSVFELPKIDACMVLRRTSNHGEYRVVGCALLPMFRAALFEDITLV